MAVHLPRAMFVGFLSFGHHGYLLSFIQHLAAASFALENLHCCGTYEYVCICTDCLIVSPLPADKRSCQLYLIQADGLASPDRAMSTPTKQTEYFTCCCCCVFPAGAGIVVIADVDAHVSLHSHLHFQQLSIVKNALRRCLRCVGL